MASPAPCRYLSTVERRSNAGLPRLEDPNMTQSSSCLSIAAALVLVSSPAILLAPATGWAQIEEVMVTARKRAESLQDVPIAINAITAEELDRKAINSISDMTKGLSSVEFDEGASKSDTRITIRGLSPTRGRQNVAVLVDGIDVSTEAIKAMAASSLASSLASSCRWHTRPPFLQLIAWSIVKGALHPSHLSHKPIGRNP